MGNVSRSPGNSKILQHRMFILLSSFLNLLGIVRNSKGKDVIQCPLFTKDSWLNFIWINLCHFYDLP